MRRLIAIMQWHNTIATFAVASTVSVVSAVSGVPAFAQSNTPVAWEAAASLTMAHHARLPVLRVYDTEQIAPRGSVAVPPNLILPDHLRERLASMLDRSPTFRRQCRRIAHSPWLVVRVASLYRRTSGGPNATTRFGTTADGRLIAHVNISGIDRLTELVAHEFEHVIEQLDGVDLQARSAVAGTGVWPVEGSFETTRARRIGRQVAREVEDSR